MTERVVPHDTFFDPGNGEFRLLRRDELLYLYGQIQNALSASRAVLDESVYTVSAHSTLASWSMDFMNFVDDVAGEFIPIRDHITVHTLCQDGTPVREVTTVVTSEYADISHATMYPDGRGQALVSEEFVTMPCSERYVFALYADGRCEGQVEQRDLTLEQADFTCRPLTLYDAERVLSQVESAVEQTAQRMVY